MANELSKDDMRRFARLGAMRRLEDIRAEEAAIRAAFPELFSGDRPAARVARAPKAAAAAAARGGAVRLTGPPAPAPRFPTLVHALRAAAAHPGGVTFVDLAERERHLPWREVHARAQAAAAALAARGVRPGDRVAIVLRTEPAFLDAFFGAWLAGAVPVPLYPPVRLGRLEEWVAGTARMLTVSGARLVVSGGGTRALLGEVLALAAPPLGLLEAGGLLEGPAGVPGQAEDLGGHGLLERRHGPPPGGRGSRRARPAKARAQAAPSARSSAGMRTPRKRSTLTGVETPCVPQSMRPRVCSTDMNSRLP